ncbi:hypothetical protein HIM_05093 [Hirsutella minnesotensis 3608]|uniref:Uncharacterized protein n=1 Tax=Hirsutella minnesotensis 3608 TaxID=1043627 RepID=A0A0F7ZPJ9_9HYPO|nr:hypothetical protein HIM_05093 [Hirsutella minnesotensis 3608]
MAQKDQDDFDSELTRLDKEWSAIYGPLRASINLSARTASQTAGKIAALSRVIVEHERQRSDLTFSRPKTGDAELRLQIVQDALQILRQEAVELEKARDEALGHMKEARAEMLQAATSMKERLDRLKEKFR